MLKLLKYKANNWVDGMKLSSAHFVNNDLYFQDSIRDAISVGINGFNYGLLPPFTDNHSSFDVQILNKSTHYLEVNIRSCNAITADGCRIDILGERDAVSLSQYINTETVALGKHYIVLQVNPFKRLPTGEPNPDETPIRYPNVTKEYIISLVSKADLNQRQVTDYFIPVGQVIHEENNTVLNANYIMPSSTLNSHPALVQIHNKLYSHLLELQDAAFTIMEKTVLRDKVTHLGLNIRSISEVILGYLSANFFHYRSILPHQSPIYLLQFFSDLANVFFTGVKLIGGPEREEMLKYFYEWKDVTPSDFDVRLSDMIEQKYNHLEIREGLDRVEDFVQVMVSLWNKLSTLEYIGQRRENIVVAEQKVVQEVQSKKTWSLLD